MSHELFLFLICISLYLEDVLNIYNVFVFTIYSLIL